MAGKVLNIKVCNPLKHHHHLTGKYLHNLPLLIQFTVSPHELIVEKTKAELEKEISDLKEQNEYLRSELQVNDVTRMKTSFMVKGVAIFFATVTAIQSIFIALDKDSPFEGGFAWWIFSFAVLYLIGYLVQLAMHLGENLNIRTRIGKDGADIQANVNHSEANEG